MNFASSDIFELNLLESAHSRQQCQAAVVLVHDSKVMLLSLFLCTCHTRRQNIYFEHNLYARKQKRLSARRNLLVEGGGVLEGRGPGEFREEIRALLINRKSIFTQLTSKSLLSFNFVVLVVAFTLTPAFVYAQNPPRLNHNSTLIMTSSSMSPNLRQNDGVIVDHFPFNNLKIGDIIAFRTSGNHSTIVHRVAQIVTENGQRIVRAKGDANPDSIHGVDYPIFQRNYIGKVVYVIPQLGAGLGAVNIFANNGGNTLQSSPAVIVPHLMQNLLKAISFFFVACFFVLGFRIQRAEKTTTGSVLQSSSPTSPSVIDKYFLLLILSSLIPALIITIYGIVLIDLYVSGTINTPSGKHVYMERNFSYLLPLFICFVPAGAVLFLVKKLHIGTSRMKT
jgi:signal peptidase I